MDDHRVRMAAFEWLAREVELSGDTLDWSTLANGFRLDGQRVPLVSQQGIFKPAVLPEIPLSIRTAVGGPYDDAFGADDLLRYKYRGSDPQHRDNVGLRQAMRRQVPLVYFHGIVKGKYLAVWPVFIVGDDPGSLTFIVAADDRHQLIRVREAGEGTVVPLDADAEARRRYITSAVRSRLHQRGFRERVLEAYRQQCALCRLRHQELLDAAHIIPDGEEGGEPTVRNGIALCKLHHAAFDRAFLGIRPDYIIEVRPSIMQEIDGPMLKHGLQGLHHTRILHPWSPAERPDPELLDRRYQRFREAC